MKENKSKLPDSVLEFVDKVLADAADEGEPTLNLPQLKTDKEIHAELRGTATSLLLKGDFKTIEWLFRVKANMSRIEEHDD